MFAVAGLRHETTDDAVKRDVVVKAVARELFEPLGVMRGDVVAQRDDDTALGRIEDQGVLGIGAGGKRLGGHWCSTHDGKHYGKSTYHVISRMIRI